MARAKHLLVENTSLRGADLYEFAATDCAFLGCDLTELNAHDARLAAAVLVERAVPRSRRRRGRRAPHPDRRRSLATWW